MENFVIIGTEINLSEAMLEIALKGSGQRIFRCSIPVDGNLSTLSKVFGVTYFSALNGTSVRAFVSDGKISNIGNIIEDTWLLPVASKEAEDLTKDSTTEP